MLWKALASFGNLWEVWKALKGFGKLLGSFERLWEAVGSLDVNMVCPSPGSWINHVPGKGIGPGFSLPGRPSALNAP